MNIVEKKWEYDKKLEIQTKNKGCVPYRDTTSRETVFILGENREKEGSAYGEYSRREIYCTPIAFGRKSSLTHQACSCPRPSCEAGGKGVKE